MSPTSVIRRYTPPTCTLEIAAKESPLSRWMGQTALKNLRFKLSFDDPRVTDSEWITVHGDRTQLQALSDAVTSYVQNFLNQSATYLNRNTTAVAEPVTELNPVGIYLQPKGLVSHELHLGPLASEKSGSTIRLSAVQLADLASALDEFATDAVAVPTLDRRSRWINTPPAWGTIAAAVVAAVGVGTVLLNGLTPSTQTAANQSAPSSDDQRLAINPLPSASPSPSATFPSSPLPLASLPPNASPPSGITTPPTAPTPPTPPQQMPNVKVTQPPPVDAPPPEIQIPVREVPVAAIPDQTKPSGQDRISNPAAAESNPSANTGDSNAIAAARSNSEAPATLQAPSTATTAARSKLPETIPQVTEARSFFQSRWQPPKELTSPVEYRLIIAPNGTVQSIIPLGEQAKRFLEDTPIPVSDEPFVSPIKSDTAPVIRLILSPNGNVQTFLESQ